jgi:peptidoglycan/xylan/chitin deacetylase (PgdA/CDA1 family)
MSKQPFENRFPCARRSGAGTTPVIAAVILRWVACVGVLLSAALFPPATHGQQDPAGSAAPVPMLVRAGPGDTAATVALRYLKDASKAWLISEYNDRAEFLAGEAVLIPVVPFKPGGLTPHGFQTVPVLAYPNFVAVADGGRQRLPTALHDQMHWLKTQGFTAITPAQLIAFMAFSGQLPARSVLITVDGGSRAFLDWGVPVLENLGFTATVFVATGRVGAEGAMTWDELRALRQAGFTIGCRGRQGAPLVRRENESSAKAYFERVESDLLLARRDIETHLGEFRPLLAYPRGRADHLVAAMAAKLGYAVAFSRSPGYNPFFADRFGIARTVVDDHMSLEQFKAVLTTMVKADLN